MQFIKTGKHILIVLDVNDADYVTASCEYSDELYNDLLTNCNTSEDFDKLREQYELSIYFGDDKAHTLVCFYVVDVQQRVNKDLTIED